MLPRLGEEQRRTRSVGVPLSFDLPHQMSENYSFWTYLYRMSNTPENTACFDPRPQGGFWTGGKSAPCRALRSRLNPRPEDTAPAAHCDAGLCREAELGRLVSALIKHAKKLPTELYQSLTWDRGLELAEHRRFTLATDIDVYFCDPQSP